MSHKGRRDEGEGREGGRRGRQSREKGPRPKQRPKTSEAGDQTVETQHRKRPGHVGTVGTGQPSAKEDREGRKIKSPREWPGKRVERDPKWSWDKSMKGQDCHRPLNHSTRANKEEMRQRQREEGGKGANGRIWPQGCQRGGLAAPSKGRKRGSGQAVAYIW